MTFARPIAPNAPAPPLFCRPGTRAEPLTPAHRIHPDTGLQPATQGFPPTRHRPPNRPDGALLILLTLDLPPALDVDVVLGQRLREHMPAGAVRHEIQEIGVGRVQRRRDRRGTQPSPTQRNQAET